MIQKSPDAGDKILQYTLVAANTLREAVDCLTDTLPSRCLRTVFGCHPSGADIRSPKMLDQIAQFVLTLQNSNLV
ncbi:hypothetical protein B0H14DRAFT_3142983 [Mycena olivaceomarginata]|nr:hypothetical protein B0H14DRAFT_3142983 [Mycena olivaceomarginata]